MGYLFLLCVFPKMILDCMQTRLNTLQEQLVALHDLKSFSTEPTTLDRWQSRWQTQENNT